MAFRSYFTSSSNSSEIPSDTLGQPEIIKFEGRNLRLTKLIAEGGFSYVYFGDFGGQIVAVKKILSPDKLAAEGVAEEIDLLSRLNHRNIVKLLGVKTGSFENYIIMEYCSQLPKTQGNEGLVGNIFRQCSNAIEYMHNLGIAHRDVKLENFLVGADGFVKLVDFGSASREVIKPTVDWNATQRGIVEEKIAAKTTPMYRAPELLDLWLNYQIDTRVDLWAMGCLLYLLNYGTHPFPDSNKLAIINAKYSLKLEDAFTPIIRGLLEPNPNDRIGFETIFSLLSKFSVEKVEFVKPVISPVTEPKREERSLFSSLRGGAESLFKNIKENIREMTSEPTPNQQGSSRQVDGPRPNTQAKQPGQAPPKPPPPKPSPPVINPNIPVVVAGSEQQEQSVPVNDQSFPVINNFDESVESNKHQQQGQKSGESSETEGILLDLGDSGLSSSITGSGGGKIDEDNSGPKQNVDLLADLFGVSSSLGGTTGNNEGNDSIGIQPTHSAPVKTNDDIFGDFTIPLLKQDQPPPPLIKSEIPVNRVTSTTSKSRNILDDLDLFGNESSIPASSSFNYLGQLKPERIVKNVSTPNLSELLNNNNDKEKVEFSTASTTSGGGSVGGIGGGIGKDGFTNFRQPLTQQTHQPNYSRSAFENPYEKQDQNKKSNLNDVFGEFLKSEGFSASSNSKTQTIQEMRRKDMLSSGMDPITIKVNNWKEGKTKNIRALLSTLHTITWPECTWREISMSEMITASGVKKSYRKACLAVHPDKQIGSEHETLAKAIFIELNEAWSAFEEIN